MSTGLLVHRRSQAIEWEHSYLGLPLGRLDLKTPFLIEVTKSALIEEAHERGYDVEGDFEIVTEVDDELAAELMGRRNVGALQFAVSDHGALMFVEVRRPREK